MFWDQRGRSGVFIVNLYFTPFSSVSIVDFEQVNVSWECTKTSTGMFHRHEQKYKSILKIWIFQFWFLDGVAKLTRV